MIEKSPWRGVLIGVLCLMLAAPANASTDLQSNARNIIVGVVAAAAAVVVITILAIHYSKKQTITGCVSSAGSGMTVTDEKDKLVYALSGNTEGVKPGDRMKLQGKKLKAAGTSETPVWETTGIKKDLGMCRP
jgi:hypothetical protein